ncbi:MAG: superoxide dismutase family protein [Clostridia bacterium]|nr:superoxide dismutase family protein [Clostridia bacterium]
MYNGNSNLDLTSLLRRQAQAQADIVGNESHPNLKGTVRFYQSQYGVIVVSSIAGLPSNDGIFAFHIHEGNSCTGNTSDPFANAGTHYNPMLRPHPYHAGDMPPLFSSNGYAFSAFLTNRFTVNEIIGKTVIIHSSVDDFTTQPSGNSGTKIACGVIIE